jgi:large subunit ribosomal protein L32e
MSDDFKRQDYFRYKRLGKKWRRPVGLQSKLRIKKGGSGRMVAIGFGTKNTDKFKIAGASVAWVHSVDDLAKIDNATAVFIASGVGGKAVLKITEKAKELNIRILNRKKVKRAKNLLKALDKKKIKKKEKKEDVKKEEKKEEHKAEHKEEHTHDHPSEHVHGHDHDQEHAQPKDHNPEHEHTHGEEK